MTNKFEIQRLTGRAKVVRTGQVYTTYSAFAGASGYPDAAVNFRTGEVELKSRKASELGDEIVKILAKGKHGDYKDVLYVVETDEGERFIFGEKGLEIIETKSVEMPEMTYVEIAEPFGKQVREMIQKAYAEGYAQGEHDTLQKQYSAKSAKASIKETSQQIRDRIVEQAKADVEELKRPGRLFGKSWEYSENPDGTGDNYNCEFIIDKDKRTVVALLRGYNSGRVRKRGFAKCAPGDCFNVHIGKAIALRRALGLEVPAEYLNAPQPTQVRVGDVVELSADNGSIEQFTVGAVADGKLYDKYKPNEYVYIDAGDRYGGFCTNPKIIDDSREVTQ